MSSGRSDFAKALQVGVYAAGGALGGAVVGAVGDFMAYTMSISSHSGPIPCLGGLICDVDSSPLALAVTMAGGLLATAYGFNQCFPHTELAKKISPVATAVGSAATVASSVATRLGFFSERVAKATPAASEENTMRPKQP